MSLRDTDPWKWLEKGSSIVFLVAGVLLAIATINEVVVWAANMETPEFLEFAGFFGMFISYVGLFGLYPQLGGRASDVARTGLALLLLPVVVILIEVIFMAIGVGAQFGQTIAMIAFGLFALGVVVFAFIILRTEALANFAGLLLLVYALGWVVQLGGVQVYGTPPPGEIVLISSGLMAIALFGIGYLLRTETVPRGRGELTMGPSQ